MRLLTPAAFAVTTIWDGLDVKESMTRGLLTYTRFNLLGVLMETDRPTKT
jgi:hypothetical protein